MLKEAYMFTKAFLRGDQTPEKPEAAQLVERRMVAESTRPPGAYELTADPRQQAQPFLLRAERLPQTRRHQNRV